MTHAFVDEADPLSVWDAISSGENALVIDVRTRPEWTFVGLPELPAGRLALIEWQSYPTMDTPPDFAEMAMRAIDKAGGENGVGTAYFICRSGVRSLYAAMTVKDAAIAAGRELRCVNVTGGFEGDPSPVGQRGQVNGWKAQGLPWRQS